MAPIHRCIKVRATPANPAATVRAPENNVIRQLVRVFVIHDFGQISVGGVFPSGVVTAPSSTHANTS